MSICMFFSVIPTTECIAISDHIKETFITDLISGEVKTRSVISAASSILVEHQPIALRRIYRESHISGDRDLITIVIKSSFCITIYTFFTGGYHPPQKAFGLQIRSIVSAYGINPFSGSIFTKRDHILTE